jgi:hypothetical protein
MPAGTTAVVRHGDVTTVRPSFNEEEVMLADGREMAAVPFRVSG